jgi:hypothetical protein
MRVLPLAAVSSVFDDASGLLIEMTDVPSLPVDAE